MIFAGLLVWTWLVIRNEVGVCFGMEFGQYF